MLLTVLRFRVRPNQSIDRKCALERGKGPARVGDVAYPPPLPETGDKGVEYVVIGAVALGLRGHPRGTRDLDLFIRPEPANVARLREALGVVWNDPEIQEIRSEDLCGEYPAVAYGPPDDSLPIDILTRLGDAFSFDDLESDVVEIDGRKVNVATPRTLYRMKKDTVWPQDQADAAWLRERYGLSEEG
jgi:hypothetical protein